MQSPYKITKGWHELFKGANDWVTYGLEFTCTCDPSVSKSEGKQHVFRVNDHSFLGCLQNYFMELTGCTREEYIQLHKELDEIRSNKPR